MLRSLGYEMETIYCSAIIIVITLPPCSYKSINQCLGNRILTKNVGVIIKLSDDVTGLSRFVNVPKA